MENFHRMDACPVRDVLSRLGDKSCAGHTESEWNDAFLRYTENHRGYFPADADGYIALIGDGRADC